MTDQIKQWVRLPNVQLWTAYLALVLLGMLTMVPATYLIVVREKAALQFEHDAEVRRVHEINLELVNMIAAQLPVLANSVEQIVGQVTEASKDAQLAAKTAAGAGSTARAAANSADTAARKVEEAMRPPPPAPPKEVPEWLNVP